MALVGMLGFVVMFAAFVILPTQIRKRHERRAEDE